MNGLLPPDDLGWWMDRPRFIVPERPETSLVLAEVGSVPEWMDRGVCKGADPDIFFPEAGSIDDALFACRRCPVARECLAFALDEHRKGNDLHGVWGGTSRKGRLEMLGRRKRR